MRREAATTIKATGEMYPELQRAYDFFNQRLFAATLPPCLITLNRTKDTYGYFSPGRFVRHDGQVTHEIAMNPAFFAARPLKATLATLVHEQVHLWQATFGTPSRAGYHNSEWAAMCEAVGLMPSSTGHPGGRRVGDHVSHYVVAGGPFDRAADDLLTEHFRLSWLDRFPAAVPLGAEIPPGYVAPVALPPAGVPMPATATIDAGVAEGEGGEVGGLGEPVESQPRLPERIQSELGAAAGVVVWPSDVRSKSGTKVKYRCPGCGNQVWGKGGMDLRCNPCDRNLVETPA